MRSPGFSLPLEAVALTNKPCPEVWENSLEVRVLSTGGEFCSSSSHWQDNFKTPGLLPYVGNAHVFGKDPLMLLTFKSKGNYWYTLLVALFYTEWMNFMNSFIFWQCWGLNLGSCVCYPNFLPHPQHLFLSGHIYWMLTDAMLDTENTAVTMTDGAIS
jgi:hypothetical protein